MPKLVPRYDIEDDKNFEHKTQGKKDVIPSDQTYAYDGTCSVFTLPCPDVISSTDVYNGKLRFFDLRPNECGKINDAMFRFTISSTSQIAHLPGPELVREWWIKDKKGSGQELFRWYPETIVAWIHSLPDKQKKRWHKLANIKEASYENEGVIKYWDNKDIYIQANHTKYIYLPIPWAVLHLGGIDMQHIQDSIRFYIHFQNDFFVSGTTTNFSLDAIDLIVYSPLESMEDESNRLMNQRKFCHSYIFPSIDRLEVNDKTLTASQTSRYELEPLSNQKSGFLQVIIKNGTSPAASDRSIINYVPINNGTIDVEKNSGSSLLGRGTPIKEEELYYIFSNDLNTYPIKGMYFVPFSDSFSSVFNGEIKGYHQFESKNTNKLAISFPAAPTQEIVSFVLTNVANDGGYFRFIVNGEITILLAYNANAAAIKAALENLSILKKYDVSVTASGAATASFTITFAAKNGPISDNIGVLKLIEHTLNDGTVGEIATSSVTTYGKYGFTTSSSYTTYIDSWYFRRLTIREDGSIMVENV